MKNDEIDSIFYIESEYKSFFFADKIICMKDGKVVEQGTHEFLMSEKGTYYNLVNNQIIDETKKCDSQSS